MSNSIKCNVIYFAFTSSVFQVEFQAIDSSFVPSPPILMHISIRTAETNAPRVSWNMGTLVD